MKASGDSHHFNLGFSLHLDLALDGDAPPFNLLDGVLFACAFIKRPADSDRCKSPRAGNRRGARWTSRPCQRRQVEYPKGRYPDGFTAATCTRNRLAWRRLFGWRRTFGWRRLRRTDRRRFNHGLGTFSAIDTPAAAPANGSAIAACALMSPGSPLDIEASCGASCSATSEEMLISVRSAASVFWSPSVPIASSPTTPVADNDGSQHWRRHYWRNLHCRKSRQVHHSSLLRSGLHCQHANAVECWDKEVTKQWRKRMYCVLFRECCLWATACGTLTGAS